MSLIVQKFGGSSVANTERLQNVADIVTSTYKAGNQVVVVVSAQGDTTDEFIEKAAAVNPNPSRREMDVLLSAGEQISMALLAMAIQKLGYPVVSLTGWQAGIQTNSNYSDSRIRRVAAERIRTETGSAQLTRDILFEKALYQASCKAAIKAGRAYASEHIAWICDRLMRIPDITVCPHGRPVAMTLTRANLDRQFKRT